MYEVLTQIMTYFAIIIAAAVSIRAHYRAKQAQKEVEHSLKNVVHSGTVAENMQVLANSANDVLDRLTTALTQSNEDDYKNIVRKLTKVDLRVDQLDLQIESLKESLRSFVNKINARERGKNKSESMPGNQSGEPPQLTEEQMAQFHQQNLFDGGGDSGYPPTPRKKQHPFQRIPRG